MDAATRAGDLARDVDASPRLCCALQDAEGAGNDTRNATEDIRLTCFGGMTHARACGYGQVSLLGRKRSPSEGTGGQLPDSRLGPICGSQGADVAPRRLPASQKSGANSALARVWVFNWTRTNLDEVANAFFAKRFGHREPLVHARAPSSSDANHGRRYDDTSQL